MDYRQEIEELLTNYKKHKKEIAVIDKVNKSRPVTKDKLKFLEYCMSILDNYQKELLFSTYINGISIRRYSDSTGLSRNFISKQRQKTIDELNRFFQIKYSDKVKKN